MPSPSHRSAAAFGFDTGPASPPASVAAPSPSPLPAWLSGPGSFAAWTDGSCAPNPGPGAWAVLIVGPNGEEHTLSGASPNTTNNRAELRAAIAALDALPLPISRVTVTTDSEYVRRGITEWLSGWRRNGWRTGKGKPVTNQDLWERLDAAAARHEVTWRWTKGHARDALNARVDALANVTRERVVGGRG